MEECLKFSSPAVLIIQFAFSPGGFHPDVTPIDVAAGGCAQHFSDITGKLH